MINQTLRDKKTAAESHAKAKGKARDKYRMLENTKKHPVISKLYADVTRSVTDSQDRIMDKRNTKDYGDELLK